jgi:hypothetical protein
VSTQQEGVHVRVPHGAEAEGRQEVLPEAGEVVDFCQEERLEDQASGQQRGPSAPDGTTIERDALVVLILWFQVIPVDGVKSAVAIAWDSETDYIFWTDVERDTINRAFWNGSNQEVIVHSNIGESKSIESSCDSFDV